MNLTKSSGGRSLRKDTASVGKLESFDFLTEEERRDILYNNAARFLELTDEQIEQHHE